MNLLFLFADLGAVRGSMRETLADVNFVEAESRDPPAQLLDPRTRSVALWQPLNTGKGTALTYSRDEGWPSLGNGLSKKLSCRSVFFFCEQPKSEWPARKFYVVDRGIETRTVQVLKDSSRWQFFQEGEPLPCEETHLYGARVLKNRLTPEYLEKLGRDMGIPFCEEVFWRPTNATIVFGSITGR